MASNGTTLYAHSTASFLSQINAGTISTVTYPDDLSAYNTEDNTTKIPQYTHAYNDEVETDLFKIKLTGASFSDESDGKTAAEGMHFLNISADISPNGNYSPDTHPTIFNFALLYKSGAFANFSLDFSDIGGENILTNGKEPSSITLTFEVSKEPDYLYLYYSDYRIIVNDEGKADISYIADHCFDLPREGF